MRCPKCNGSKVGNKKLFRNVRTTRLGWLAKGHPVAAGIMGALEPGVKAIDAAWQVVVELDHAA